MATTAQPMCSILFHINVVEPGNYMLCSKKMHFLVVVGGMGGNLGE